jgi:tetratricopeptide (TPR) repeat protein
MFCSKLRFVSAVLFALALSHIIGVAQDQNSPSSVSRDIHGQIRFSEGGAPAQNVLVRLESYEGGGSLSEVFTDPSGKFRFSGLSPAQYIVRVRQAGFLDTQQHVDLQTSSNGFVMLQLVREKTSSSNPAAVGSINANVPPAAQKEFDKGLSALGAKSKEKTSEAAHHFERAISIYPSFVEAHLKLGTVYMDLEEWDKAEAALLKTVEIDPKAANALFALSEIYLRQNQSQDAERVLVKGLEIEDRSYLGHMNLARVYWERSRQEKDLNKARPTLEKAYGEIKRSLELNPDLAAAHLLKGNLLLKVGRTNDAVNEFDEYLRLEPKGTFAAETRALVERIKKSTPQSSSHKTN